MLYFCTHSLFYLINLQCLQVQAYDADEGVNAEITYTLSDKEYNNNNDLPISIDPRSGWVYTSGQLDREVQAKYQLMVRLCRTNEEEQRMPASQYQPSLRLGKHVRELIGRQAGEVSADGEKVSTGRHEVIDLLERRQL